MIATALTEVSPSLATPVADPVWERTTLERLARFAEHETLAAADERTRGVRLFVLALIESALAQPANSLQITGANNASTIRQ